MLSSLLRIALPSLVLSLLTIAIVAQDELCPSIVSTALEATNSACDDTGRNQVCFGNIALAAAARPGVDEFAFKQQGDIVDVAAVQTITLSSMDAEAGEWGVALMRIQANIPDTLPGQNLTFLLFGDVEIENAVDVPEDGDTEAPLTPMQAFYFRSGIGDAPCEGAPDSGLLIQTPEGAGEIEFTVNEVNITLASTTYLQAEEGADLTVNVVEGMAEVEAQGVVQTVPAGARVSVPLDEGLSASGPPNPPEPYDEDVLVVLPLNNLEREIVIVPALTPDEIETFLAGLNSPYGGEWSTSYGQMIFHPDGTGVYYSDNGRLLYTLDQNILTGYWVENSSAARCEFERDGSFYWGRIHFEFSDDFTSFEGLWAYCENEPDQGWDGTRQNGS
jgi:hypothetical protein